MTCESCGFDSDIALCERCQALAPPSPHAGRARQRKIFLIMLAANGFLLTLGAIAMLSLPTAVPAPKPPVLASASAPSAAH